MRSKNYYFIEGSNLFPIEHVYLIELEAIITSQAKENQYYALPRMYST